ncbi:hypothetical protein cyc_04657 [Cyclospora cayetanensis]|uniref:Uncharacterized protein n=1 Tax=Cyclospora cayetanensis TaxID=88456 RepID=A0A1D3CYT2_9EIME|nr:hypothetical protein cyc_04657 [Cyclospora cayetanensis]
MRGHCTPGDWAYVMEVSDPEQQLRRFMRQAFSAEGGPLLNVLSRDRIQLWGSGRLRSPSSRRLAQASSRFCKGLFSRVPPRRREGLRDSNASSSLPAPHESPLMGPPKPPPAPQDSNMMRASVHARCLQDFYFRLEEEKAPGYVLCICVGPPSRALKEYKSCMPRVRLRGKGGRTGTVP